MPPRYARAVIASSLAFFVLVRLWLADGSRCTFLTGATSAVAGLRVNYGCAGGTTWVVGAVDRRLRAWTVFVMTANGRG